MTFGGRGVVETRAGRGGGKRYGGRAGRATLPRMVGAFRSCDVDTAVARDARPYRLQRFERTWVKEKIDDIHSIDAVMVERRIVVEREQELRMVVADGFEWREFAGERGFVADSVRHLEVAVAIAFKRHEIDFSVVEHTYVDFAEPAVQLKVNDVFKQMSEIFAFRSEKGTAKPASAT